MKPLSKAERWKKEQVLSKKEIDYLRRPYSPATICDREQRAIRDRLLATIEARDERIKELEEEGMKEKLCTECGSIIYDSRKEQTVLVLRMAGITSDIVFAANTFSYRPDKGIYSHNLLQSECLELRELLSHALFQVTTRLDAIKKQGLGA